MVNDQAALDNIFSALAAPARRQIVARLARGECTVSELSRPLAMSAPAVSKHLRVLERSGLLRRRIDGRVHRCRLDTAPLTEAAAWLKACRAVWEERFDNLAAYLETLDEGTKDG